MPAGLTNLTSLQLAFNLLTNVTLPADLTKLSSLNLYSNRLSNLSFLSGLGSLSSLDVRYNQLTSLTLPAGLTNLFSIAISNNQLTNLTLPSDLLKLGDLYLPGVPLQRFVLPEPLAQGVLASLVAQLRNQGVSVFTYPLTVRLLALPVTAGAPFEFRLNGPPGTYRLQVTEDFSTWTELDPVAYDANGPMQITDPSAGTRPHSFYRALRSN